MIYVGDGPSIPKKKPALDERPIEVALPDCLAPEQHGYRSFSAPGYEKIVESLGVKIVCSRSCGSYSGQTHALVQAEDGSYGYLDWYYGSCSGCDAVEACGDYEELGVIREGLRDSIIWTSSEEELHAWIHSEAWEKANSYDSEAKLFVDDIDALFEPVIGCRSHDDCKTNRALAVTCLSKSKE